MMTAAIGISFQYEFSQASNKELLLIGLYIAIVILAFIISWVNGKSVIKEKNEPVYYKICLEILDELENENCEIS
ncbi:hypothetical protein [Clostridium sp.]|uniref:hypothetical protein n=1 Tax=Clostridium sp. TaxID=1506 RepID=UPI0026118BD7|nr:hypothetical protein [Clostridium sp.]